VRSLYKLGSFTTLARELVRYKLDLVGVQQVRSFMRPGRHCTSRGLYFFIHRRRWDDNTKMDLEEVGWWGMDWIHLTGDRDMWWAVVNAVVNLRVAQNEGNFLTS
jgi:hypothetical protein